MPTTTTGVATEFISFTRASNATVVDSNGLIDWAAHNLLLASEQFDASNWTKGASSVTGNSIAAPNGSTTADTLVEDGTTANHRLIYTLVTIGARHTFGVFLKAGSRDWAYLRISDGGAVARHAYFNLSTGAIGTVETNLSAQITSVGSGWYLCTVTVSDANAGSNPLVLGLTTADNTNSHAGNGTGSIHVWGAHLYRSDLGGMQANTSAYPMYNPTTPKNLVGFTESFDNAFWGKSNTTTTANVLVAPNGLSTADKLAETATTAVHIMSTAGPVTITTGGVYTFSIYAKAAERSYVALFDGATSKGKFFDLSSGTVLGNLNAAPLDASITAVGTDGWYRCSIKFTGGASAFPTVYLSTNGTIFDYAGTAGSGIYIWGAQLSDSASLDTYTPNHFAAPSAAAYYGPRRDFDPVTLACKGLLVEEQRTNRVQQTEDFTVSPWVAAVSGTSTIVNGTNARGFRTATVTATSALGGIRQIMTSLTSGQVYTLSFYVQSTATSLPIVFENGTSSFGAAHSVTINPSNGTAGFPTGFTSVTSTPLGSGYIYQLVTLAAGGSLTVNLEFRLSNSGDSFQIGRPQFENGSFATSYIPVGATTAGATRSADVAQVSTAAFPYSSTESTLVAAFSFLGYKASTVLTAVAVGTDANNLMRLYQYSNTGVQADAFIGYSSINGGAFQADVNIKATPAVGAIIKGAAAFKANDFAGAVDGGTVVTDTSGTIPAATVLGIGSNPAAQAQLNGHIRQITYIPRRLSNAELQARTV